MIDNPTYGQRIVINSGFYEGYEATITDHDGDGTYTAEIQNVKDNGKPKTHELENHEMRSFGLLDYIRRLTGEVK